MSHVTRYDIAGASSDFMKERENGEFVKFEDYKKLETALLGIKSVAEIHPQDKGLLTLIKLTLGGA